MIGAVCYEITNKYEARIYVAGTYHQIDWTNKLPCALGSRYSMYALKNENGKPAALTVSDGLDGQPVLRLVETKRYVLRLTGDPGENVKRPYFQNEDNRFLKIEKDHDRVTFQFINYLGYSRITFGKENTEEQIKFEVISEKMNSEEDYIALTEALAKRCSGLLMEYSGVTSNLFRQSEAESKTVLEQFIFLRQFCYGQNLRSLFEAVRRNPDRVLKQEEVLKPAGQGIPSGKFYTNPFAYSRSWQNVKCHAGRFSYLPGEISVTQKRDSIDTPANRFVKYALEKFDAVCMRLIEDMQQTSGIRQAECLSEAKAIHRMLEEIFHEEFFAEIGLLEIMPQNNQVLQKREGYSQIFSAYSMIDLALQLDWKGKDRIYEGESKNVALLYEYWLFFELYKMIGSVNGCEPVLQKGDDDFLRICDSGLVISLQEGKKSCQSFVIKRLHLKVNLYYNRTFSKTDFQPTRYEGSYSRSFRPDYTIAIFPDIYCSGCNNGEDAALKEGAVSYLHFDAKYRVTDLAFLIGKNTDGEDLSEDKTDEVVNTYKRGDLLKMHTYNDAIRRTIGSFVLYPGSRNRDDGEGSVFSLYDEPLPAVGAFAIRPGNDGPGENELKSFITLLLESKGAVHSRLSRMNYYAEMVRREPGVSLTGIQGEPGGEREHTINQQKEQCVLGYIKASSKEDYYQFLVENKRLVRDAEFYFYFYAIKGSHVYAHHPDVFRTKKFCFYTNSIEETNTYIPEPVLCRIESDELVSKGELVRRLRKQGYETCEEQHSADFYYVLKVKVMEDTCCIRKMDASAVNTQNGNDGYGLYSPKIIIWKD